MEIALIVFLIIMAILPVVILITLLRVCVVMISNYLVSLYHDKDQCGEPSCPIEPNYSDSNIVAFQHLLFEKYNVRIGLSNRPRMLFEASRVVALNAHNAVRFNRDCGIDYISPVEYYSNVQDEYDANGKLSSHTQCQLSHDPVYNGLVTIYNNIDFDRIPPQVEMV